MNSLNLQHIERETTSKKLIIFFIISGTILLVFTSYIIIQQTEKNYSIILDDEEVSEFFKCDDKWNYQNKTFIPCVWNGTIDGIPADFINWSLSPQENCIYWNGTFPGFNIKNDTISKDMYDEIMPQCIKFESKDINKEFLKDCYCIKKFFVCEKYKCGENLEIRAKW